MHDESSNSQNDNLTLTDLSYKGTGGRTVKLSFSDGSFFYIPLSFVAKFSLLPNMQLPADIYEALYTESQVKLAYIKAVELLGPRAHSVQEIKIKLTKREYQGFVIDIVVERLLEKGYLDDREFAIRWLESRVRRHPEGPLSLRAGLARKGISGDVASSVIMTFLEDYGEEKLVENARAYLEKRKYADEKIRQKLIQQGFSRIYI